MSGYDEHTGEYRAHVSIRAAIILGPDSTAAPLHMSMTGHVLMREWPYEGYQRRQLADGRVQLDLEMVESSVMGALDRDGGQIAITETTAARNLGTLTQIYADQDFPAAFELARLIEATTPLGILRNRDAIIIRGILDRIPPISQPDVSPEMRSGFNLFEAVNAPVAMYNERGEIAAYFGAARGDACFVRMTGLTPTLGGVPSPVPSGADEPRGTSRAA